MSGLTLDVSGVLTLQQKVKLLNLKPSQRRLILRKVALSVRKASRKNIKEQRQIDGSAFAKRKGRNRRKMLRGLAKTMVAYANDSQGFVTWKSHTAGRIAKAQHDGISETMTAAKMQKLHGRPDYKAPATRQQAKALKKAGYKAKTANGFKNVTLKWITENLTVGQAGMVLGKLEGSVAKRRWDIPLAARPFLGVDNTEYKQLVQGIVNDVLKPVKAV